MKPSTMLKTFAGLHKAMRPVYVDGPPGGGKSSLFDQYANNIARIDYKDVRLFLHGTEDFKFPVVNLGQLMFDSMADIFVPAIEHLKQQKGMPAWAMPLYNAFLHGFDQAKQKALTDEGQVVKWLQTILPTDPNWVGMIVLEELPQAPPIVQNVASPLLLERRLGNHKLSPGTWVVACGNRQKDRAGANRLLSQVFDRVVHLELESDLDDWIEWALKKGIRHEIISYLRWRPANLNTFNPNNTGKSATPRGWEIASDVFPVVPKESRMEVLKGILGEGIAGELLAHIKICDDLPDIDECIKRADRFTLPTDPAICYAFVGALGERAKNGDRQTHEAICTIGNRFQSDYGVLLMKDAMTLSMPIRQLPAAKEFLQNNKAVLLSTDL